MRYREELSWIRFIAWSVMLQWLWEVAHGPAYVQTALPLAERIPHCAPMALVDAVWTGALVLASAAVLPRRLGDGARAVAATAAVIGAVSATLFESWAISAGRWSYNDRMPLLPYTAVGLWPVLQMAVIPPLTLWLSQPRS